jgi:hypothetical protein
MGLGDKLFSEDEIKVDKCERCGEFNKLLKPTEKGWLCSKCVSQEKIAFHDQSEDYFWED